MWNTGSPIFPLKRGLMTGRESDRKKKCHVVQNGDQKLSAMVTPDLEKRQHT